MIELLPNLPAHIVGVNASGQVDAADYEKVLVPAVDGRQEVDPVGHHGLSEHERDVAGRQRL